MGKVIYDTSEMKNFYPELKKKVDRAVVAAAVQIRDRARTLFVNSQSLYKYRTKNYKKLKEGLMIGKFNPKNSSIKIHALGTNTVENSYKTRFFVGGTVYRKQKKKAGKPIKPYSKGFIKPNKAIDDSMQHAENYLGRFIKNALKP